MTHVQTLGPQMARILVSQTGLKKKKKKRNDEQFWNFMCRYEQRLFCLQEYCKCTLNAIKFLN